jgi:hypothetical protein
MNCKQCNQPLESQDRVASISGSVMGDEYSDVYYRCPSCGQYTVALWRDNFTGEETVSYSGPLSKETGDERVGLIGKCSQPWDKKCRCDAHREYFGNSLD